MQAVVLRLADADLDGHITLPELTQLDLLAQYFAATATLPPPNSLPALLDSIYLGFDRNTLASQLSLQDAVKDSLVTIAQALKVNVAVCVCGTCTGAPLHPPTHCGLTHPHPPTPCGPTHPHPTTSCSGAIIPPQSR